MGCKCYNIARSAGSQTNNISPKHDSMTAEFCKNLYHKTYLNDFRLGIRKQESIRKISNWVETDASAQSTF